MRDACLPGAALLLFALLRAVSAAEDSGLFEELRIERAAIDSLDTDGAQMTVVVGARMNKSGVVRGLVFDDVTINGISVHIPPVATTIHVRAGEWIQDLPALKVRLPFRDLQSLGPIRQMVSEGEARIQAVVRAELQLSLFEKLAIMARDIWVAAKTDRTVEVAIPGGSLGRFAALSALLAAEPVWILGREAVQWRERQSDFSRSANSELARSLVLVETKYSVTNRAGESASLVHRAVGLLLDGGKVLTTGEALEPWSFDASLAEAIQTKDIKINAEGIEMVATFVLRPEGVPARVSLQKGELRIYKRLKGDDKAVSGVSKVRYRLRVRDRNYNAAMLIVPALAGARSAAPLEAAKKGEDSAKVAVFRLEGSTPGVILTEARREGDRVLIDEPFDSRSFGSPVWSEAGILGMMQDSRSAVPIDRILRDLQ